MTFLIILGVTEILCSFRLYVEGKTGKEIPESSKLEFFEKFRSFGPMKRYSRFTFHENTIGNSPKVLRAKFLGSDGLFCFTSVCKYASSAASRTLLHELVASLNLTLDSEDLLCWYKRKK